MTTDYKIIAFNESTGQITLKVADLAPMVVDLPIDENGNLPTVELLTQYLVGFIPTWHFDRQEKLANGIANAGVIRALVEPEPIVELTTEQKASNLRAERNIFLASCDWTQTLDAPLTETAKAAWAEYRQALRDVPLQNEFPQNIQWPVSPDTELR